MTNAGSEFPTNQTPSDRAQDERLPGPDSLASRLGHFDDAINFGGLQLLNRAVWPADRH